MNALPVSAETVLKLLRQLPPRERLRVVSQVLPELEAELPASSFGPNFWTGTDLQTLADSQGVRPAEDFDSLLGGWPEEESIDEFLATLRSWHQQNPARGFEE